jgi:serine/threonine protein phosphatase PrpC
MITAVSRIEEARRDRGEDRIAIVHLHDRELIIVADGAGGSTGGARAAEALCRALTDDVDDWAAWLKQQDAALIATGLAAAVVLSIHDDGLIRGASVGDCEAWVFGQGAPVDLTTLQIRKPLLGSGHAVPVHFSSRLAAGAALVVATDGLWKYVRRASVANATSARPLGAALPALVDGVRLRSGTLQDDVAIVLCEVARS